MADPHELLRSFLADRDQPCPSCGYNLRGLTTNHCPECAVPLGIGLTVRPPLSKHARRGIIAFAIIMFSGSLMRGGLVIFFLWKNGPYGNAPNYYVIRTIAQCFVSFVSATFISISLYPILFKARDDERIIQCLRWTATTAALAALWEMLLYLIYYLFS